MDEETWHLDKRVPISIIAAIVIQTITFVYIGTTWKVEIEQRVSTLEKAEADKKGFESRLIILEQQLKYISDSLGRIEKKLEASRVQ